jgi:SulP family sulfate permease
VWAGQLQNYGVEIVGSVKQGYPAPVIPPLTTFPFWELLPTIMAVAFLGVIQSVALAKAMVRRHPEYRIDSNQELLSLGLANMGGAFFNAYPVAGSFSRTAVNDANQAQTSISLITSMALVLAAVLFLIPLMHYLPVAALAAIIITAVPNLIDVREAKFLWQVRRREFVLMVVTFVATLALGVLEGMGVGVFISLGIVLHRTSYPNIVMLGRLPNTQNYRDLERFPEARTQTNTIIVRIDASLYFANITYMREKLEKLEVESGKSLNQVIIDAIGINKVDRLLIFEQVYGISRKNKLNIVV